MIRQATPHDGMVIIGMLERYKDASPLAFHKNTTDISQARKILAHVWAGAGVCFVSEDEDGVHGMILAVKLPNVWDQNVYTMNEIAYWVNPEKRGTTAGYRLLKEYVAYCEDLKSRKHIEYFTVSKMSTSPDLDYGRFGFEKLEEMWSQ